MGKIIGIDLGTTNSLVAVVDSGIPLVLADDQGRRLTPSVVRVPAFGDPVVGWEAKRARAAHPETTITSIKRFMGRRGGDSDSTKDALGYPVRAEGNAPVTVPLYGREWTPEEVSAEILKLLKTLAGEGMIELPEAAVITGGEVVATATTSFAVCARATTGGVSKLTPSTLAGACILETAPLTTV